MCCLLGHITVQPSIGNNVKLLNYLNEHSHLFDLNFFPYLIVIIKIFLDLCIEIINILIIYSQNDVVWIVMCYTSMAIV